VTAPIRPIFLSVTIVKMIVAQRYRVLAILLCFPCLVECFAAKKKGDNVAKSSKGFGVPPESLESVLSKFPTRLPDNADDLPCPCGSSQTYGSCCAPFHRYEKQCLATTDVLRSRYSAFKYRLIQYVMDTTHETCRDYRENRIAWAKDLHKAGMFDSYEFVGIEAGPEVPGKNENEGFITFQVRLRAKGVGLEQSKGSETIVKEKSRFLRDPTTGVWSYASGEVRADVAGLEDTILNP
jgi:SEC-C motif-containing protein